jgi:hypothetical protein
VVSRVQESTPRQPSTTHRTEHARLDVRDVLSPKFGREQMRGDMCAARHRAGAPVSRAAFWSYATDGWIAGPRPDARYRCPAADNVKLRGTRCPTGRGCPCPRALPLPPSLLPMPPAPCASCRSRAPPLARARARCAVEVSRPVPSSAVWKRARKRARWIDCGVLFRPDREDRRVTAPEGRADRRPLQESSRRHTPLSPDAARDALVSVLETRHVPMFGMAGAQPELLPTHWRSGVLKRTPARKQGQA